jgi:hypothetical protein
MAIDLGKTRWLMFEQGGSAISTPLLAMLVFWLAIIFTSFGLFAPRNATVMTTLFLCAGSSYRDLFDPGNVLAFQRVDSDFQCSSS